MSRIGKLPVVVPQGVKGAVSNGMVSVEGPKGRLSMPVAAGISVALEGDKFLVSVSGSDAGGLEDRNIKTMYGTTRALLNNMVVGVTQGWKKSLELVGVGFGAKLQGNSLILTVGFSHDVVLAVPEGVTCQVTKNTIELQSVDKEKVGTFAAKVRDVQPPEPYLGKGIKYAGEAIRRKAGKTGKK
jgi:large subunit ribosomal protein L6